MRALSFCVTCRSYLRLRIGLLLLSTLGWSVCLISAQTSPSQISSSQARIAQRLELIHLAEQQHLPKVQQGALWAQLASDYQHTAEFLKAEDAYNRSLQLLKTAPTARAEYASALDNLASLYLIYHRVDDAESTRKQALMVRQKLGNLSDIGVSHINLADIAFARRQFKKADRLVVLGMKEMESSSDPPKDAMLSGLITDAYARCLRGHCDEGLKSAEQAVAFVNKNFGSDSSAAGFAQETLGFAEWKSGATQDGEKAMLQSIRILRTKLTPADPRLAGALVQYRDYLIAANRHAEAQEIHEQLAKMNSEAGGMCEGCTVSVYSLPRTLR